MTNVAQRSFGSGELAPGWFARTDLSRYVSGLRTCRNFMVQKSGGVTNRPGTDHILSIKSSSAEGTRLIKFVFNDLQAYVLEMGQQYIRFYQRGAPVVPVGDDWVTATEYAVGDIVAHNDVFFYAKKAHTSSALDEPGNGGGWPTLWSYMPAYILELPTPYQLEDLDLLQYVQSGNTISMVHPDYPPHDLIRDGTRWTMSKIAFGPTLPPPEGLDVSGAGSAGTIFYAVTAIMEDTLEETQPAVFQYNKIPTEAAPNSIVWEGVPGAISYNIYRSLDGVTYGLLNAAGGLPSGITDATWIDSTATATSINNVDFNSTGGEELNNTVTMNILTRAYDNNYSYQLEGTLTPTVGASGISSGKIFIYAQPTGGIFGATGPMIPVGESDVFTTVDGFTNGPFTIEGTFHLPISFLSYSGLKVKFVPAAKGASVTGMVDFTIEATTPPDNVISWQTQIMAYGDYGQDADNAVAPPSDPGFFKAHGDFPSAVGFYQQRRFFAGTINEPLKVWGSQIGRFTNFAKSTPLLDTDAVSFTMVGPQANSPRHLIDLGKLLIMTMGGEMRIDGDDSGIIRPDSINPNSVGENGISETIRPLKVVDSAVYVQARGNIVRTMRPVQAAGQQGSYEGTELSIFASHLFEGKTIVDWDYAKTPNSIVWVVFSDGTMAGLTYQPEHGIWAWHRHDTDGIIERVICVPEGDEDRVYMIVRREIDGETIRFIERMASRYFQAIEDAHFLDCASRYNGTNTTATTVTLSAIAASWTDEDLITATFSGASITAEIVGQGIFVVDASGEYLRLKITEYVSTTVAKGTPDRVVPGELRNIATAEWALAVNKLDDLDHLSGRAVSILGDGNVVANPNRLELEEVMVDPLLGTLQWDPDELYVNVLVGLPYVSDLQTLDLDTTSGASRKEEMSLVTKVGLYVKDSRGFFAGLPDAITDDDPAEGLQEYLGRDDEEWDELNALVTDFIEVGIDSTFNTNGRVFVRNIDPLPLNVLSITPMGYI